MIIFLMLYQPSFGSVGSDNEAENIMLQELSKDILMFWRRIDKSERAYIVQLGLLILFQFADTATTFKALEVNDGIQELNLLVNHVINHGGYYGVSAFKLIGACVILFYLEMKRRKYSNDKILEFNIQTLRSVNVIFACVSVNNLYYYFDVIFYQ